MPHTKGPWSFQEADINGNTRVMSPTRGIAYSIYSKNDREGLANLILISHAPELLRAAKALVDADEDDDMEELKDNLEKVILSCESNCT